jgi:hypothetical protein
MNEYKEKPHSAHRLVAVTGKLPSLSSKNLKRLSVFLARGNEILAETAVNSSGVFHLHVTPKLAEETGVSAVLGPKGMDSQSLSSHATLPRLSLQAARRHESGAVYVDFSELAITNELIEPWWLWCREYTVSGTLLTAAGCPIPAEVTVYNVTSGVGGLIRHPLATVPTAADGSFTASFNWCSSRFCWWPCWPFWWRCWPWWWELDILAIIENIERRLFAASPSNPNLASAAIAPLRQPHSADLMTGVGFAHARASTEIKRDSARTALIASKLSDARIREIFPWWWWCCEYPNIVFSATQGAVTILDEDPNTSTRWCFGSGQTVSLTGNSESLGACPVGDGGECGFAWTSVGSEPPNAVLVENISMGYAIGSGACANLAFAGSLNLNGVFSGGCVSYYQVLNGQWTGNPARGGSAPASYSTVSQGLVNYVTIWRNGLGLPVQYAVNLGPFSFNGHDSLYCTLQQRQSASTPAAVIAQIGAFPSLGAGDFVMGWAYPDLVLTVPAASLVTPNTSGGVNLTVNAYDVTGTALPAAGFDLGPDLTLMIDSSPLTNFSIDHVSVYNADGSAATQTMGSSTVCPAYQITPGGYALIHTTVSDDAGHLCEYYIQTQYGDGLYASATPSDRDYAQAPATFTPPSGAQLYGVGAGYQAPNAHPTTIEPQVPAANNWMYQGGSDTFQVMIPQSCCYDFQLWVSKRLTDGETFGCGAWNPSFQTVNIVVLP